MMSHINIFPDMEQRIKEAVRFFWTTRDGQNSRQSSGDVHDQGNRGAVTGGKQLDGFIELIRQILIANGVKDEYIFFNTKLELPGYYTLPCERLSFMPFIKSMLATVLAHHATKGEVE